MTHTVKHLLGMAAAALLLGVSSAWAQDTQIEPPEAVQDPEAQQDREFTPDSAPEIRPIPDIIPEEDLRKFGLPDSLLDSQSESDAEGGFETADDALVDTTTETMVEKPDYSRLTESEERAVRLDLLFARLQAEENAEMANLIAEEIWAIWLDSGSASVDMLLRRGTAAQKRGDDRLARRMYNHVIELSPDYAEGWARSARLAYEEDDLSRALTEVTQALILEPRQFYAHWTLGNIFEKIGRTEDAYETYKEASRLYPELLPVKSRLEMMKGSIEGDVL